MSMTVYTYRDDAARPVGSYGPLDETDDMYHVGGARRLDPTCEQELAAGWCNGPNFSNHNALMILRSLGLEDRIHDGCVAPLDAGDLHGRLLIALAVGGMTADDGQPDITAGQAGSGLGCQLIDCGVRPGYFADAYARMLAVCEQAIAWDADVHVC